MPSIVAVFAALLHAFAHVIITLAGGNSPGTTGSSNGGGIAALAGARRHGAALRALLAAAALARGAAQVEVTTLAGGVGGSADGIGTSATFFQVAGVAVDPGGNIVVAAWGNSRIRSVTPGGVVSTLAGSASGYANGVGAAAQFFQPSGVAVDSSGNVYVADTNNHRIRKVTPGGAASMLAGSGTASFADGTGGAASFNWPRGVAVDAGGNVFVGDGLNHRVRRVTPGGAVTTFAGGAAGFANGIGAAASFDRPYGIAVDALGNLYVADTNNDRIRKVTPGRAVSTLAGSGTASFADGTGAAASFRGPLGVAVDAGGNVFVADSGNHRLRRVTPVGVVTTLAGSGAAAFANGVGAAASFNAPNGVCVNAAGDIFVGDYENRRVRMLTCAAGTFSASGVCCCTSCSAGTYNPAPGSNSSAACLSCGAGLYSSEGAGTCCSMGSWSAPFSTACAACPSGRFSATQGATSSSACLLCPAGTYSPSPGSAACLPCAAGTYNPAQGSNSSAACLACAAGTFAMGEAATSCQACPGGHFCPPGTSSWARLNCGLGSYCPEASAEPIPCPIQMAPLPYANWALHPMTVQGPAFLVETASCLNHCFWNFTSGDSVLSKC